MTLSYWLFLSRLSTSHLAYQSISTILHVDIILVDSSRTVTYRLCIPVRVANASFGVQMEFEFAAL
jgi:hypothetical protein